MTSKNERKIGPSAGDLLECPRCGHPQAVRTKPKLGDRDTFSCPVCGDDELTGSQIAELKAKRISDELAAVVN